MRLPLLTSIFFINFLYPIAAQQDCQFYVYRTTYTFPSFLMANEFEKNNAESGRSYLFTRLSDTTFVDFYKLILRVSRTSANYYLNATQYMEPMSCSTFSEHIIFDTFLSSKEIQIDSANSSLIASQNFAHIIINDSIFISVNDKCYLRYLLKGSIVEGFHPEFKSSARDSFKSIFLRKENQLFFGDTITLWSLRKAILIAKK